MNQENKHMIDDLKVAPIQLPSDSYFEELKKSILKEIGNDGLKKKEEEAPLPKTEVSSVKDEKPKDEALLPKTEASPGKSEKLKDTPRIISMYKRWYVWGSAAAILAFIVLFPWNNTSSPANPETINLSSVSNEEIYDYLSENIEDLDSETIAVHLSDEAITDKSGDQNQTSGTGNAETETFSSKSTLLDQVEDQEILDYLKNESGELDEYLLIES